RLCGPLAARGGEARLTSPARAVWRYVWRYRARYGFGIACLGAGTYASLTIPWTVKRAIDALQADAASAPVGYFVALIASFAFVGVLAAMLAVDPWLTLWSLAPSPILVVLARRFNVRVNERTEAAQNQLSVLSERVQEYVAGMSVVRAYTLEPRARADFGRANGEYLRLSLALARTEAGFSPLMGLIAGIGTLIVLWAGGRAVVDGRLTLGALVAF